MVHLGGGGGAGYQTMMPTCTGQDESSVHWTGHSSHSFSVGVSAASRAESALIALQHGIKAVVAAIQPHYTRSL